MMIIAFLISAAAAAQEFISLFIYRQAFDNANRDYVLMSSNKQYFIIYGYAALLFVFSFLALLVFFAGAGKKTTGAKEGVLLMFASLATAVAPAANLVIFINEDVIGEAEKHGHGAQFRAWNEAVVFLAPVVICLFIFLAGLGLVIKVKASKTVAPILAEPKPVPQPVVQAQPMQAQPVPQPVVSEPAPQVVAASAPVIEEAVPVTEAPEAVIEEVKPVENVCKNCGETLPVGTKFCRNCGAKQGE